MRNYELFVVVLLIICAFLLLLNFNAGRGSFARGYMNGFKDGVKACIDELKTGMKQMKDMNKKS